MGTRDFASILDLSVYATPPVGALMVALKAYGDESGKEDDPNTPCIAMGAVMGDVSAWPMAEARWRKMLDKHQIPEVHMKVLKGFEGPYAKYRDPLVLMALFDDIAAVIIESGLICSALTVRREDFLRICREFDIQTNMYSFTVYVNCVMLGTIALNARPKDPRLQIILDRMSKGTSLVAEAERLYTEDRWISWRGWPHVSALGAQGLQGSSDFPGLQMADVIAWHARNHLLDRWEWYTTEKLRLGENNFAEWDKSMETWQPTKFRNWQGSRAELLKYQRVFARLKQAQRLRAYYYDHERLKNHIFNNRSKEGPQAEREGGVRDAGRLFPLTP